MIAYLIRRVLLIIPTMLLVTAIVFLLIRLVPGNVLDLMVSEWSGEGGTPIEERTREALAHRMGLDVPIHVQYARWMGDIARGDLGKSLWTERPVVTLIRDRLVVSTELGIFAIIFSLLIAIPVGIYSAIRQDTYGDYITRSIAILFISLPSFWLGTIVIVYPAIWWSWTPSVQYVRFSQDILANLGQFLLPAFIMGMVMSGTTMRMTRTMMLEVLRQDYIRTAWAKGLRERTVIYRHALKNAMIPVITIIGLMIPFLIGGSVIIEQIFCLPGVGLLLLNAIQRRDYPIVSGVNLMIAAAVMFINLFIDITYAWLDPRIRYS